MMEIGQKDKEWEGGTVVSLLEVTGMVGSPAVSRSRRDSLSFFINRRWVSSRLLAWAVEEAYHGLLMQGKHPVAIINISLPPEQIDVNIHPAKAEVKFQNERLVFTAVQKAVRQTLIESIPVPKVEAATAIYNAPVEQGELLWTSTKNNQSTNLPLVQLRTPEVSLPVLRVLGQLLSSYIVAEGPDGLYLIDQHAAHERIRFEQIKEQRMQQKLEVQGLLEAVTFEVTPQQDEVLKMHYEDLAEFGFSMEPFGDRTYLTRTIPALLYDKDWMGVVREVLDSLGESNWVETMTISMACHSAIRAGQTLAETEMRELVRQLERVTNPHTCPHGRPTMIHLSSDQLRKDFGRS
jgi:DNA mismatch repair protein MutL